MRFSPWSRHSTLEVSALVVFLFPLFSCSHSAPATEYSSGLSLGRRAADREVMCSWNRPQSALFRDTIFLDGGTLIWQVTGDDGKTTIDSTDRQCAEPRHQLYYLNLTSAFSLANDGKTAIQSTAKPETNMGTNFKNGFMLANDYQFIVYGGYMEYGDKDQAVGPTWSLARDMVQNGETPLQDPPKYRTLTLEKVTRYIAAGGSVNVPSENRAYVFSGATGRDWGEFYSTASAPDDYRATYNSTNLISVDMSTMGSEKWDNKTIPSGVPARKNAEVVWLPVGSQGTLVVIGGALNRDLVYYRTDVTDEQKTMGQAFVDNVHLYDIANDKWYTQQTSGDDKPPATSEFCTSYAASQDGKSFQIYAYGGWEDFSNLPTNANPPSANVYVLSLPAFKWVKVYDDKDSTHGRRGHRCHKVADNLMMVVGGALVSNDICINEGIVKMFNLNTLKWEDKYDPAVHDVYKVPEVVYKAVGGTEKGGANVTPSSWNSTEIRDLFGIKYTKTVTNHWPYPSVSGTGTNPPVVNGTVVPDPDKSDGGMPSYVPPLLGAILGLLVLITVLCGILFCLRRRKARRKRLQSDSAASTVRKNRQTWSWLLGVYGDEKRGQEWVEPAPSEPSNPFDASVVGSPMREEQTNPIETAGRQLYEMPDTSVAQELSSGPAPQRRVTISEQVTEIREDPQNKISTANEVLRSDGAPNASMISATNPITSGTGTSQAPPTSTNRGSSLTREEGGDSALTRLLEEDELHTPISPRDGGYRDNP
ncbi:unnamed protein product [Tuber aestivum]|uniref:Kelch repeat protein n=1 Tax=Tuber aestivum TaxID=59557 RepID=A0A292Q0F5_9PEZI|nr:unnamed protein product [Tuber aestivum]